MYMCIYMHICMYIFIYICMYIYIYREREAPESGCMWGQHPVASLRHSVAPY